MIYYGQGFTHGDIYTMPVYLRNFYYRKLADQKNKENDEVSKQNQKIKNTYKQPSKSSRFSGRSFK